MRVRTFRRLAVATAIGLGLVTAVPAISATTYGSITIVSPKAKQALNGVVEIDWSWRTGTYVKSTSKVDVHVTNNGYQWAALARGVGIRTGGITWTTGALQDAAYAIRVQVVGTTIRSTVGPLYVDNTAPVAEITRPSRGEVIVDDETYAQYAVVVGRATVAARAIDNFTGVDDVLWELDGAAIGTGRSFTYDFSGSPGKHILSVSATDNAGNLGAAYAIEIMVLPGSGAAGAVPSPGPQPTPPPVPVPSDTPTPPPVPVPSDTPTPPPVPTVPPLPIPTP